MKKGFTSILLVLAAWMIVLMFLIIGLSRLRLAISRGAATYDKVVSTYDTESVANDALGRVVGGFPGLATTNYNLANNTKINIKVADNYATVSGTRNWASSTLQFQKSSSGKLAPYTDIDLIFVLDCSTTMNNLACDDGSCVGTRMDHLKSGVLSFLNKLNTLEYKDYIHVGILMFTSMSDWMQKPDGVQIRPENKVPLSEVIVAVESELSHQGVTGVDRSMACKRLADGTNIGGAMINADNSLRALSPPSEKHREIIILYTDGETNTSIPDTGCPGIMFCPGKDLSYLCCPDGTSCSTMNSLNGNANWTCPALDFIQAKGCKKYALNQMGYGVVREADTFYSEFDYSPLNGLRENHVELYTVLINSVISDKTKDFFTANSNKYYYSTTAGEVNSILDMVYTTIYNTSSKFVFMKPD